MLDINKHKFFLVSILKEIFSDIELSTALGFKGGTAQMLFYGLPRFSVDLDFNLLDKERSEYVFDKIRSILKNYGAIRDEAMKYFGLVLVLDYGAHERNLKIEVSNRVFPDSYESKNYLGIIMNVMKKPDMFAHKLCALLDRNVFTNRDIFDIYYFMQQKTPVNKAIVEQRMNKEFKEYLLQCISKIEKVKPSALLGGLGELVDPDLKNFVKHKLKQETILLLKMYFEFPILS
ncbi:MAG: nucleotidyl transferase AbiEii/AbiGii toxin family protein [Candidatus Atribacteria bacterium]|nr:nucleotidyl transferase AbiEii/AbiGii toxin family protein [Candidatus Atribacteria bacterium]